MLQRPEGSGPHRAPGVALPGSPRVALVHDWLTEFAGSERVLARLAALFPEAPIFTTVCTLDEADRARLGNPSIRTSFVQRMPGVASKLRYYMPLMPMAIEQHDLSGFDLVISSSHAVSKGVLVRPDALHLTYCHSPARYAWDMQAEYLREERLDRGLISPIARLWLHYLRIWDSRTATGVDAFAANSPFVAQRIARVYRRRATVIAPPVDTTGFAPLDTPLPVQHRSGYYVAAQRLVGYKRVDLLVRAFARLPGHNLVVAGAGPQRAMLEAIATPNVTFTGHLPHEELRETLAGARAFLFAALEDFGIAPIEALACGTPVIAYGRGGAAWSVPGLDSDTPCGVHFAEQTLESVLGAIRRFEIECPKIKPEACIAQADRFSTEAFDRAIGNWVATRWTRWREDPTAYAGAE